MVGWRVIAPCKRVPNSDDFRLMIPRWVGEYMYPEHTSKECPTLLKLGPRELRSGLCNDFRHWLHNARHQKFPLLFCAPWAVQPTQATVPATIEDTRVGEATVPATTDDTSSRHKRTSRQPWPRLCRKHFARTQEQHRLRLSTNQVGPEDCVVPRPSELTYALNESAQHRR